VVVPALMIYAIVALLVYVAPAKRGPWRWASAGSILIVLAWLLVSAVYADWLANIVNLRTPEGTLALVLATVGDEPRSAGGAESAAQRRSASGRSRPPPKRFQRTAATSTSPAANSTRYRQPTASRLNSADAGLSLRNGNGHSRSTMRANPSSSSPGVCGSTSRRRS